MPLFFVLLKCNPQFSFADVEKKKKERLENVTVQLRSDTPPHRAWPNAQSITESVDTDKLSCRLTVTLFDLLENVRVLHQRFHFIHPWFDDASELFRGHPMNQIPSALVFLVYLKQHQRFFTGGCFHLLPHQPGVLITRAGNDDTACGLVVPQHLIHSEEQEMTVSQSEGSTETQRGAFYTLSSSSQQKVNKKDKLEANSC